LSELQGLANLLTQSGYFSDAKGAAQAGVKVLAGRELGIPPIASMMGIHIIGGKIALGGNLIASRIRAHGYDYRHKQFNNEGCVLVFLGKADHKGNRETLGESSFTRADAETAGVKNDMYKKFPRNMFFNRAISNGAKWYTPEVFAGAPVYTPEELGANVDENGDVVQAPQQQNTPAQQADFAQQRIAEERAKAEAATKQQDAPPMQSGPQSDWRAVMVKRMNGAQEQIGKTRFFEILGAHGVESLDQIKTPKQGNEIFADVIAKYTELKAEADKLAATETPFDATEAGEDPDSWVPDNIGGAK
jgi:hypothetical protein